MQKSSLVSIIIINYNGKKWLSGCLRSVLQQTYKHTEIILVDNASTDGSIDSISKKYPQIILQKNKENLGYAGGSNSGYKRAKGEFVLILNTDIYLEKDYVAVLLHAFDEIPNLAIVQSKIVYMQNEKKLDTCGGFWTDATFLYYYGNSKNATFKKYNKSFPVFTVKGVAPMMKKSVIDAVKLYDDDFWCYYEETDLCHRVWLAGYSCWYYPKAVVHHVGGGTTLTFPNNFVQFHNFKNKLLSFLKNFEGQHLLFIVPTFIVINIGVSILWALQGKWKHSLSLYKAIIWNIQHYSSTLKKRKHVQQLRTKKDREYLQICKKNPRLSYYISLFTTKFENYVDSEI